jgi:hypothetical protein
MISQLVLNFRLKTTKGLSDFFILGFLNSQSCYIGFTYSLNLPLVYKVMNPFYGMLILILVFQRFLYAKHYTNNNILFVYIVNFFCALYMIFYTAKYSIWLGKLLGWIPIFICFAMEIFQLFKIYCAKSIRGFSLYFVIITIIAYSFEFFSALTLGLPKQVLFTDIRGMTLFSLFLISFFLYGGKYDKKSEKRVLSS